MVAQATSNAAQKSELLSTYNTRISKMLGAKANREVMNQPTGHSGQALTAHQRQTLTIDGLKFKRFVQASYLWLRQQEPIINSYNVYPVPDGDTGTNMMHTMRSAWETCQKASDNSLGSIVHAVSMGAIRGSRGNSGIILSQIWRGFARSIDGKTTCNAQDLAHALREAANTAYAGVNNPVEGTMLTVIRDTADAAERAAAQSTDLRVLIDAVTRAAFESVQRTPSLLKILKEAGVVDSGGYGLYVILDGMRRFAEGEPIEAAGGAAVAAAILAPAPAQVSASPDGNWGYDVQYLVYASAGKKLDVESIRTDITAMGECPLIIGDEEMVKVHVHVPDPGVPLSYGIQHGTLKDIVVENMQEQSNEFTPGQVKPEAQRLPEVEIAIVAVASGAGIIRAFKDVGARAVVSGGQTMNPSVEDLLQAVKDANARHVILLPNNGNIIMTAQQAAQLADVPTEVVQTRTIPQGIAAAIAFNFERDMQGNMQAMNAAAKQVVTGEITTSTRSVVLNGVEAREGQVIGLINDKLILAGEDVGDCVLRLLEQANAEEHELITLYYGNNMPLAMAEGIAQTVREHYPSQEVDLYEGQQPYYFFVIGIE
jgi:DAK2 domain fusion protein YloV